MIKATQIRKGIIILLNDKLYRVEEMEHVTPGKGQAMVQTKIRDLNDMTIRNYRFRSSETVERVVLDTKEVSFSSGECATLQKSLLQRHYSLIKDEAGERFDLGRLSVYADTGTIKKRILTELPTIIFFEFLKISVICICVFLLFIFLFHRHTLAR